MPDASYIRSAIEPTPTVLYLPLIKYRYLCATYVRPMHIAHTHNFRHGLENFSPIHMRKHFSQIHKSRHPVHDTATYSTRLWVWRSRNNASTLLLRIFSGFTELSVFGWKMNGWGKLFFYCTIDRPLFFLAFTLLAKSVVIPRRYNMNRVGGD